jgi:hypothetical protein
LQELELDAIRGYNGWVGSDRFGFELHEFRVAVDRINGEIDVEEVLVVTNVNEETLQGEAVWERVPVADRPAAPGSPNYVEEVLAFLPSCQHAPTLACPTVSITVHPSDTKTHKIPSNRPDSSLTHLVTVKGTGDVMLQATISPDTPRLRSKLTWEADGAVVKFPVEGDRLTAKISRNTQSGARIPVRLRLESKICQHILVWVIWCELAPKLLPGFNSTFNGIELGMHGDRGSDPGLGPFYSPSAHVEWTATIHPLRIIEDNDRPAIYDQLRQAPPGVNSGVPSNTDRDATDAGFSGWDMSRQIQTKCFKGNPDKVPPEPIFETTASDPNPDDRPKKYPTGPTGDVEGNDDSGVGDEDCNPYPPYEGGLNPPGRGEKGKLRSGDRPRFRIYDAADYNMAPGGEDGDTYRHRWHFREFVRVQLGNNWYRCSDFGLWRWHLNIKRLLGAWNAEPGQQDRLDPTNNDF